VHCVAGRARGTRREWRGVALLVGLVFIAGCIRNAKQEREEGKLYEVGSGETIHVRHAGGGPRPVLLLAGNNCSGASFEPLLALVEETEAVRDAYTFYALDYRGSGESTYRAPVATLEDFARDFDDVVQAEPHLQNGDAVLVGHSMGFGVAQLMVSLRPDAYSCLVSLAGIGTRGVRVLFAGSTVGVDPSTETSYRFGDWADSLAAVAFHQRAWLGETRTRETTEAVWNAIVFNDAIGYDPAKGGATNEDVLKETDYAALIDDVLSIRYMPESLYAAHRFNASGQTVSHVNRDGTTVTIPGAARLDAFYGKRVLLVKAETSRSDWRGDLVIDDSITRNTKHDLRAAGASVTAIMLRPGCGYDHGFPLHRPDETLALITRFAAGGLSSTSLDDVLGEGVYTLYPDDERNWEQEAYGGF